MNDKKHIGFVVDLDLYNKMRYIVDYEGRSINGTLRFLLRQFVESFEAENGEIKVETK